MATAASSSSSALPATPVDVLDPGGAPRYGAYLGSMGNVDLSRRAAGGAAGKLRHFLRRKHWVYGIVAGPEVLAAFAIVDLGYASNAFAFVVDLASGRTVADVSFLGVPGVSAKVVPRPGDGANATFVAPGAVLRVTRAEGTSSYQVEVSTKALQLQAVLEAADAPTPLAAILPLGDGGVDCTQKANLLPVTGTLHADGRTWSLAGSFGGLDYTQGLMPRRTAWRWAFALGKATDGTPVGLNLTDGLSDAATNENALWVGREVLALAPPRFTFDANQPMGPWQLRTSDGAVDLRFTPKGLHREDRNLGLVVSHFLQVAGTFHGTVRDAGGRTYAVEALPGVTEDQRVVW